MKVYVGVDAHTTNYTLATADTFEKNVLTDVSFVADRLRSIHMDAMADELLYLDETGELSRLTPLEAVNANSGTAEPSIRQNWTLYSGKNGNVRGSCRVNGAAPLFKYYDETVR